MVYITCMLPLTWRQAMNYALICWKDQTDGQILMPQLGYVRSGYTSLALCVLHRSDNMLWADFKCLAWHFASPDIAGQYPICCAVSTFQESTVTAWIWVLRKPLLGFNKNRVHCRTLWLTVHLLGVTTQKIVGEMAHGPRAVSMMTFCLWHKQCMCVTRKARKHTVHRPVAETHRPIPGLYRGGGC